MILDSLLDLKKEGIETQVAVGFLVFSFFILSKLSVIVHVTVV